MIQYVNALLAAEDPTITHHWLLPETAEIVYGGLASVIVIGALVSSPAQRSKKVSMLVLPRFKKNLTMLPAQK